MNKQHRDDIPHAVHVQRRKNHYYAIQGSFSWTQQVATGVRAHFALNQERRIMMTLRADALLVGTGVGPMKLSASVCHA